MVPVDKYCSALQSLGYKGGALTDFDCGFGWVDFYNQMKKAGLKPILGATLSLNLTQKSQFTQISKVKGRVTFLVETSRGYENLCLILSAYSLKTLTLDRIIELQEGIIFLISPDHPQLTQASEFFSKIVANNLFFEVHRYEGAVGEAAAVQMAASRGQCVATQPTYYLNQEDWLAHEVLMSIGESSTLQDEERPKLPSRDFFLKSPEQMTQIFGDHPEWVKASDDILERISFKWDTGTYHIPKFGFDGDVDKKLYEECLKGLEQRLDLVKSQTPPEDYPALEKIYRERLEEEYQIICKMRFSDYFLVVADFIQWSKSKNIPVGPGRGSGAGSLAAYCLSIVDIDPVKYNLLFERFLNPERVSMPDFDVDFCIKGREQVIQYVREKYNLSVNEAEGKPLEECLRVAQIITFGKMKSKAVIRDVGRALGIPYADVDAIAKLIPNVLNVSLKEAYELEPQFSSLRQRDPKADELLSIAERLEGLNRHSSVHAAGVVIADDTLTRYLPLYRGSDEEIVSQFEMKGVEKLGLLKFDFLGLRNLTVIQEAIQLTGESIDLLKINYSDPKVMGELSSGDTVGIFQLESSGMRDVIKRLKPTRFEDIIAIVALYRPGPLEGGMVDDFILRKAGKKEVTYDSPVLEPILRETYGVFVYQEQVMKTANLMASYSLGEADLLRRAMGKKIAAEMAQQREKFVEGAVKNNHPRELAQHIFDLMSEFAKYGFNKSHAAAYAMVTIQTAFLKTYYPDAFYAALLSSEKEDIEKIGIIIRSALKSSVETLPPHVNHSLVDFSIATEGLHKKVRFGLSAIKNLGEQVAQSIVEERCKNGPYKDAQDFFFRIPLDALNKRSAESLIRSGSLDHLGFTRSSLFASLDSLISTAQSSGRDRLGGQKSLFAARPKLKSVDEWPDRIRFNDEKNLLGTYISGHPLKSYSAVLQNMKVKSIQDVIDRPVPSRETEITIAGLVVSTKEIVTKKGTKMAFISIEDLDGLLEVVVFSDLYSRKGNLIGTDRMLMIRGQVVRENDVTRMLAREIEELSLGQFTEMIVRLREEAQVEYLDQLMERAKTFPGQMKLKVSIPIVGQVQGAPLKDTHVTLDSPLLVRAQPEFINWVEKTFGSSAIHLN